MKIHSISLITGKRKSKITVTYSFIRPMVTITTKKNSDKANVGEDTEESEPSYTAGGNVKWCSRFGKQSGTSSSS